MQATSGAPLSPTGLRQEQRPVGADGAAAPARRTGLALGIAALALLLDVGSKVWAVASLEGHPPVRVLGDLLRLELARNPGAAFSTGTGLTWVITVIAVVAAVVVLLVVRRVRSTGWAWALGLLLAGVLGNLADRLFRAPGPFRGHVVDFIELPHWPIFNVADMCINVAAALIVVQTLRGVGPGGGPVGSRRDAEPRSVDDAERGGSAARMPSEGDD